MISAVFIIGMIYFYNRTNKSEIVKHYKEKLPSDLQKRYNIISEERKQISIHGYILGIFLSLLIVFYNIHFTPFLISNAHFTGQKNKKKCKINSRSFTYDSLTFSSSVFILEEVKDEI